MVELILACTVEGGIGYQNKIPWKIKDDLNLFKFKTMGYDLICGSKTHESLPQLEGRRVHKLSKKDDNLSINKVLSKISNNNKIFVIGGAEIYNEFLNNYSHLIEKIHLSIIKTKETYECDAFVEIDKIYKDYKVDTVKHMIYNESNKTK